MHTEDKSICQVAHDAIFFYLHPANAHFDTELPIPYTKDNCVLTHPP